MKMRQLCADGPPISLIGPDLTVPIEESWGAMARLVEEGLVRFTLSQEQKLLSGRENSLQEGNYGHDH
jgi:hypothetical protein